MTERFDLEKAIKIVGLDIRAESADEGRDFDVACRMIVNALEEIQQYRAIGTVEEFKVLKESKCKYWNAEHEDCTLSYEEIRAKVIDEFAERLKNSQNAYMWCCTDSPMEFCGGNNCESCMEVFKKQIDEIAEEMGGVE